MKHLIESQQLSIEIIGQLFKLADKLEKKPDKCMKDKIMACLFYEPSTRTRFSFESAMLRLGGGVVSTENAKDFSSASKGETLEDTIKVVNNYVDVIILRHHEIGSAKRAASVSDVPIINAGDGAGQHPTQALLDLYTIKKEVRRLNGIKIAMVGDLKNGRTVRSLAYLLSKYKDVEIFFVSPNALKIGEDIKNHLEKHKIKYQELENIDLAIKVADVIYQTRIQKERFDSQREYEKYKGVYIIDKKVENKMKPDAIIMHPLPRVGEITTEIDDSPKAAYFKQAKYGLLVRMAILKYLLEDR